MRRGLPLACGGERRHASAIAIAHMRAHRARENLTGLCCADGGPVWCEGGEEHARYKDLRPT